MTRKKDDKSCTFCGQPIDGEPPVEGEPCGYCGSSAGGYVHEIRLPDPFGGSQDVLSDGASYSRIVLEIARSLLGKEEHRLFGAAVILLHTACETAAERRVSAVLERKGIREPGRPVAGLLYGYNLADDRVRSIYVSLTGDAVHTQPFWSAFRRSADRRNEILHHGTAITRAEAEESLKAAEALLAHLKRQEAEPAGEAH